MKKVILFITAFILLSFSALVSVSAEAPVDIEASFDENFAEDNQGKLTVTVKNILESDALSDIGISLVLPEGVTCENNEIGANFIDAGGAFSHDFVLTFANASFFGQYGVLLIAVGAAVLVIALVVIFFVLKKKKGKNAVSMMLVICILAGVCSFTTFAEEAESTDGTYSGNFSIDFDKKTYEITVNVKCTVAVPAESNPLKSEEDPDAYDDCNTPHVGRGRIKEGAGPLTDHNIYIGNNDFMFIGETVADYTGTNLYRDARLERLAEIMTERNEWAKENGIKFYFVICPNKATVYSDYVPEKLVKTEYSRLDQVVDYFNENTDVTLIDLRDALIGAREEYGDSLYYKYDTHWNQNGGFVAYSEIMKYVSGDFENAVVYNDDSFNIAEYETYMKDMPYYLGFYSKYYDEGPVYSLKVGPAATLVSKKSDGNWGQFRFAYEWEDGYRDNLVYTAFESKNSEAPSLYMLRDSYAIALVPFFKESFSKSVFNWTRDFSKSEILESGADVVIFEITEKNLDEIFTTRPFTD